MDFPTDNILLILAGCLGGFVSGVLGVGGGIVFVPILDFFLLRNGVNSNDLVLFTLANSFLAIFVSGVTGSYAAFRAKEINLRHLFSVSLSAIVAVLLTSYLISLGTWYTPFVFKLFFSALLLFTVIKTLLHIESEGTDENMGIKTGLFIGLITGVVSGLSGLGGGIVMIPLFMVVGKLTIKKASILSLAVIPVLAFPNIIYYLFQQPNVNLPGATGYIAWTIITPVLIGVLITVKLGVNVSKILSPKAIRIIFASFIIITIIKTLSSIFPYEKNSITLFDGHGSKSESISPNAKAI